MDDLEGDGDEEPGGHGHEGLGAAGGARGADEGKAVPGGREQDSFKFTFNPLVPRINKINNSELGT